MLVFGRTENGWSTVGGGRKKTDVEAERVIQI